MRLDRRAAAVVLAFTAACGNGGSAKDLGPPPGPDHQQVVRTEMDRLLGASYTLAAPSAYRFAAPVPHRVARWLFDGGDHHSIAPGESIYVHGWGVEFEVRPDYAGYPKQPTQNGLALFVDGALRGLFVSGSGNAPLELDKWHAKWVDRSWWAARRSGGGSGTSSPPLPAGR